MKNESIKLPQYKQRLEERRRVLEFRAEKNMEELQAKGAYFSTNAVRLLADQISFELSAVNPFASKVISVIFGGTHGDASGEEKVLRRGGRRTRTSSLFNMYDVLNRFSRLGSVLLPFLYTIGERKLLSYSLKGAGKVLRFALRSLFGVRRKRR